MSKEKYNILMVTGIVTSEHDPKVNHLLRRMLESTGKFQVKINEEFRGATAETLDGYDAVLVNYDGKTDVHARYVPLGATAEKTLCDYVAKGGGIIIYHSSVIAQEAAFPKEFVKMIGASFMFSKGGRKNPKLSFRVDTVKGDPICEGQPDYWYTAQDDLFVNAKWLKDSHVEVLATVYDGKEDYDITKMQKHLVKEYENMDLAKLENLNMDNPVIWKNTYGKGRVFVPFIGHGIDTIRRTEFVSIMVKGCEWACSGTVTIPYPDIQQERRFASWPYYDNISISSLAEITEGI